MRVCPKCGYDKFYADQVVRHVVIVDGDNDFVEDVDTSDADNPYGPYVCCQCGHEVSELNELKEVDE